ncbi:hypothetical protein NSQ95_19070 [Psychrobacillus sp. FSL W7-1457]|uniref:hypothetical protein n=1 Tax=unclassified Psychrobacillus TaxID=2636677 RepID=UPI0030F4CFB5
MKKDIYIAYFRQVLMTNHVTNTSISLQSTFEELKKDIELNSTSSIEEKKIMHRHLMDAHHQMKNEISGQKEE